MCTSVALRTKNRLSFLGRNMDFVDLPADYNIYVFPRNYQWVNREDQKTITNPYAIIGMGLMGQNQFAMIDGMNEQGLMGAVLYFEGYAYYSTPKNNVINLACYDVLFWALSQFQSIEELAEHIAQVNIVGAKIEVLDSIPPMHWIFSDRSGRSIVVEKTKKGLKVHANKIGVMTNSPDFEWQLTHLGIYSTVSADDPEEATWGRYPLEGGDLLSGTFGIPGDFSSPSRFVRAAFMRNHIEPVTNEVGGVRNTFKTLEYCEVAKGAELSDNLSWYTIYTNAMCAQSGTYYYNTYNNHQINAINLFKHDLNAKKVKKYPFLNKEYIHFQHK